MVRLIFIKEIKALHHKNTRPVSGVVYFGSRQPANCFADDACSAVAPGIQDAVICLNYLRLVLAPAFKRRHRVARLIPRITRRRGLIVLKARQYIP